MSVYRLMFLCLLAVTLGLTGPLARGLSPQKMAASQIIEITPAAGASELKTGSSNRCLRGAITWFGCWQQAVPPMTTGLLAFGVSGNSFDVVSDASRSELKSSRIFRPPRLS